MSEQMNARYTDSERKLFDRIEKALQRKGQVILYGPPGTGKTYTAKRYTKWRNQDETVFSFMVFIPHMANFRLIFDEGQEVRYSFQQRWNMGVKENHPVFVCEYINSKVVCYGLAYIAHIETIEDKFSFLFRPIVQFENLINVTDLFSDEVLEVYEGTTEGSHGFLPHHNKFLLQQMTEKMSASGESRVASLFRELEMCTFHPSYTYEDFIEGFKPQVIDGNESSIGEQSVAFQLEDGVFKNFCNHITFNFPYYFIIDEINRGNIPKIFGELITIMEKSKRGEEVTLPQSKKQFSIPENLHIIGTMNTSDRSIKMMDAALKRRFAFIEVMPDLSLINQQIDQLGLSPADILRQLNEELIGRIGRDKQIGHAYFMHEDQQVTDVEDLRDIFDMDIIPLVQEYCHDDYKDLSEIVGEDFVVRKNGRVQPEINRDVLDGDIELFIKAVQKRFGNNS